MGGSGLLFVDFDLHMKMQINIVVPTQNKTKNGAEKLGRKVKAPTWGRFTPRCGSAACSWPPGGYQLGSWHFSGSALSRGFSFVLMRAVFLTADLGRRKGGTSGILGPVVGI